MPTKPLSSCQNEFVSISGSTSVAFMIRAATTALHIALRCWFKPPLHRTRKYPLLSDSVGGGGQYVRGAEDALQPFECAVLHNLFTSTSLFLW